MRAERDFLIYDSNHSEYLGKFTSFEEALEKVKEFYAKGGKIEPNIPPCSSSETCSRFYEIQIWDKDKLIESTKICEILKTKKFFLYGKSNSK